jgi:hypothetical protein
MIPHDPFLALIAPNTTLAVFSATPLPRLPGGEDVHDWLAARPNKGMTRSIERLPGQEPAAKT